MRAAVSFPGVRYRISYDACGCVKMVVELLRWVTREVIEDGRALTTTSTTAITLAKIGLGNTASLCWTLASALRYNLSPSLALQ
jgi:molybdenum cofactor biosynthesis enzyme